MGELLLYIELLHQLSLENPDIQSFLETSNFLANLSLLISPLLAKMNFEITLSDQILDDLSNIDGNLGLENLYSKDKEVGVIEVLVKNVMTAGFKKDMEGVMS